MVRIKERIIKWVTTELKKGKVIAEAFCLEQYLPLEVLITKVSPDYYKIFPFIITACKIKAPALGCWFIAHNRR
jgi:hypothetical protein